MLQDQSKGHSCSWGSSRDAVGLCRDQGHSQSPNHRRNFSIQTKYDNKLGPGGHVWPRQPFPARRGSTVFSPKPKEECF